MKKDNNNKNEEKLKKYFETHNEKLREELVNDNVNLVTAIALQYSKKLGLNIREVSSYGFEGLLMAIDNYNPSINASFSTYAYNYIRGYILCGIPELQGTKYNEFYRNFIKYKTEIEDLKGARIQEDVTVLDDILNKMVEDGLISRTNYFYFKEQILLNNLLFFEDMEEEIVEEDNLYDDINNEITKELVEKYLSILTPRQREVIEYHFGLNGKPKKTLEEIGKIFDITHEGVRRTEIGALNKIRRYNDMYGIKYPDKIEDKNNSLKGKRMG